MLMLGPIRNLQGAAFAPVEALTRNNTEAFAFEDMHGLFAVTMLARVPVHGNFRLEHVAAHCRKAEVIADHQLDLHILWCSHPRNILVACDKGRRPKIILDLTL